MFVSVMRPDVCIKSLSPDEVSGVSKNAMESNSILPARLHDSWNFAFERKGAEAETAYAELA
jgi:hypothetical protein